MIGRFSQSYLSSEKEYSEIHRETIPLVKQTFLADKLTFVATNKYIDKN